MVWIWNWLALANPYFQPFPDPHPRRKHHHSLLSCPRAFKSSGNDPMGLLNKTRLKPKQKLIPIPVLIPTEFLSFYWYSFTSRLARVWKFSSLSQHGLWLMSTYCLHFGTMSRPCLDHVWPNSIFSPARALKHERLSKHGLMPMSLDCLLFGAMSGPWLHYVGTMFGLAFFLN